MKMRKWLYSLVVAILTIFIKIFYPYRLTGSNKLPQGGAVVCANHSSNLDPVIVAVLFGPKAFLRFMAKAELFHIPGLSWLLRNAGVVSVDRGSSDIEAFRRSVDVLKSGQKLMLFPEGTRVSADEAVAAKTGAVRLAARHKVPIVPIYISRTKRPFRKYDVCVGEGYSLESLKRGEYGAAADDLMERIAAMDPERT
jgi:1-acyl-sn-glycerol-3-phosphate acyltransferase